MAMKKKKTTIAGAVAGAVAGLKDSVVRAEIAVVRAGNKAVRAVQDRVNAGRRKATSKKKAAASPACRRATASTNVDTAIDYASHQFRKIAILITQEPLPGHRACGRGGGRTPIYR